MNLSEKFSEKKILPILAVVLLIVTIALPLLFSTGEDTHPSIVSDTPEIEVLLNSQLEGYEGKAALAEAPQNDHSIEVDSSHRAQPQHAPEETPIESHAPMQKNNGNAHDDKPKHEFNAMHGQETTHQPVVAHSQKTGHEPTMQHELKGDHAAKETHDQVNAHVQHETKTDSHIAAGHEALKLDEHTNSGDSLGAVHEILPERVCYEIGPVKNDAQKNELEVMFRGRGILTSLKYQIVKRELGHWVYLPPLRSLALGRLKVEEIKLKGIKDVNLLINHEPKFAISLGIFNDQKNAYKRLLKAQSLGFNAKMDIRHIEENELWLNLEGSREKDLNDQEWSDLLQQHSPIELKAINCL